MHILSVEGLVDLIIASTESDRIINEQVGPENEKVLDTGQLVEADVVTPYRNPSQ